MLRNLQKAWNPPKIRTLSFVPVSDCRIFLGLFILCFMVIVLASEQKDSSVTLYSRKTEIIGVSKRVSILN